MPEISFELPGDLVPVVPNGGDAVRVVCDPQQLPVITLIAAVLIHAALGDPGWMDMASQVLAIAWILERVQPALLGTPRRYEA
ncbi:hypothetical protein [Paractinoplanes rishiriensis]|uniref:Uncharacterized protein n=1 Tax=Paractinoplanes rishiriensis TaxID=1050105 RepID=A0A919MZP2_9ACTN|nr:hypothetical protein [Actinoplanes rishiriensis]GIE94057.1 hypothetical protein Ari01nite_15220 [Actinoplanes rishiriensis]